jgi:hypothetical protein
LAWWVSKRIFVLDGKAGVNSDNILARLRDVAMAGGVQIAQTAAAQDVC